MNDQNINEMIQALTDFMSHVETDIDYYEKTKEWAELFYEQKAAELEITVDYYIQEFV